MFAIRTRADLSNSDALSRGKRRFMFGFGCLQVMIAFAQLPHLHRSYFEAHARAGAHLLLAGVMIEASLHLQVPNMCRCLHELVVCGAWHLS